MKPETIKQMDDLLAASMERWRVPGVAIGLVQGERVLYSRCLGSRNRELGLPITERTRFMLGSLAKAFIAIAFGRLIERGLLEWDAPIKTYLPEFRLSDPVYTETISLRDVLTHRTGLGRQEQIWSDGVIDPRDVLDHLHTMEVLYPIGTTFHYNNITYMALGHLMERVTGKSCWSEVMAAEVYQPLGLTHCGCALSDFMTRRDHALCYGLEAGGLVHAPFPGPDRGQRLKPRSSGSVFISLEHMFRWMSLHLQNGRLGSEQLLPKDLIPETFKPQVPIADPTFHLNFPEVTDIHYGAAWILDRYRGFARIHHAGIPNDFSHNITLLPEQNLGLIIFSNRRSFFSMELSYELTDLLLELEPIHWKTRFAVKAPRAQL